MQWCLTTGTTWIFGIVSYRKDYGEGVYGQGNYADIYTLSPRQLSLSKNEIEKTIEEIAWLLMCWVCSDITTYIPLNSDVQSFPFTYLSYRQSQVQMI